MRKEVIFCKTVVLFILDSPNQIEILIVLEGKKAALEFGDVI